MTQNTAAPKTKREPAPPWHALVQPGPKGDPARTFKRREDRGQVVPDTRVTTEPGSVPHGKQQHGVPVRAWPMFGLVLHRTRLTARSGGGIDRTAKTAAAIEQRRIRDERKAARTAAAA